MSPQVIAAIKDTEKTLEEQRKHLRSVRDFARKEWRFAPFG